MKKAIAVFCVILICTALASCAGIGSMLNTAASSLISKLDSSSVYTPPEHTVAFITDCDIRINSLIVEDGERIGELPVLERTGYEFKGWYVDGKMTIPAADNMAIFENTVLRASWVRKNLQTLYGIDVSTYQGDVNWNAVAQDGVSFAFVRCGYRSYRDGSVHDDQKCLQNINGARAAGLDVGVYFFSQAISEAEAREEADFILDLVGGCDLTLPIVIDFEFVNDGDGHVGRLYDAKLTKNQLNNICYAFFDVMEDHGRVPMIYANANMLEYSIDGDALSERAVIWAANWGEADKYTGEYDGFFSYRQYSCTGRKAGIDGDVDLDMRFIPYHASPSGFDISADGVLSWKKDPIADGYVVEGLFENGVWELLSRQTGTSFSVIGDSHIAYRAAAFETALGTDYVGNYCEPLYASR